jgi:hypothetical protein
MLDWHASCLEGAVMRWGLASLCGAFVLFAASAHAQPAQDTVHLASGGFVRGTIAESIPNDHVTLVLATGETRIVPWADVAKIEMGTAPGPAPASPAPEAPPMHGPTATVHITSPVPVVLDRRPAGTEASVPACAAPCDAALPVGDTYRVEGAGLRSSGDVTLSARPGARTELVVTPAKKTLRSVGMGIAGLGGLFDVFGIPMLIAGIAQAARSCAPESPNTVYVTQDGSFTRCRQDVADGRDLRTAGIVVTAIGVTASAIGLWLWLKNETTRVEERPAVARRSTVPPSLMRVERRPDETVLPLVDFAF